MWSRPVLLLVVGVLPWVAARAQQPPGADEVTVGVLTDNYPFSFQEAGEAPAGFAVDLLREIEATMALRLERRTGPTNAINPAFAAGEIDLMPTFAQSEQREAIADFSIPYLRLNGAMFVHRTLPEPRSLADLRGRRVLVHRGSLGEQLLQAAGLTESIVYVESVEQAFRMIAEGQGDATLASRLTGMATIHHLGLADVVAADAGVAGYDVRYCFAVREGDARLLAKINEGLAILHSTGRYDAIYRRWFGRFEPARFTAVHVLGAVAVGLSLALGVALWAYVRQRTLHRQIAHQSEQLRTGERRLRRIFDASPEALLVVTGAPSDLARCQLRDSNPAALRLFGWKETPAPGRTLAEVAPEQEALWAQLSAASGVELPLVGGDEPSRWVRGARVPLETGEDQLLVLVDLTLQRRATDQLLLQEQQLRQAQKLEALGTLSSGIAHDFNNILSCILGNTELAQMDTPPDSPVGARLAEVLRASLRARELVRQVLTFSRHAPPFRDQIALASLVEECLQFIRAAAPSSIELEFQPAPAAPPIHADPTQVHQVLMNLCTNAVQAIGRRAGRLVLTEEVVRVDGVARAPGLEPLKSGDYLRLSVGDSGPGIPAHVLPRIFEPYFTTKPTGEGTGLGLAVVQGIMSSHQGAVTVSSEPGVGTLFHLYFPVLATRPTVRSRSPFAESAPVHRRVMIIDDEFAIVDPAGELLRRVGCEVTTFVDPQAAVAEFAAHPDHYDLVICDLTMPQLTGLDVVRRVRAARATVPFVLVSGFLGAEQRRDATDFGVDAVLDKPLTREALHQALNTRSAASVGRA